MPDFGFDGVSSSLAKFMSFFLFFFSNFFFCMMYVTQTPQTTDSTRAVQGTCYNLMATTPFTPAACQQSRKQHHTRALVCPVCTSYCGFLLILAFAMGPRDL